MPDDDRLPVRPPVDPASLWARAESVVARWEAGEEPEAAAALRDDPELATDRQIVLYLAYEEYCLRREAGEGIDAGAFAAKFSGSRTSLKPLLSVHRFM